MPANERLTGLILNSRGIESIRVSAQEQHTPLGDIVDFINNPSLRQPAEQTALASPDKYLYAVAFLVANYNTGTIPLAFQEVLQPQAQESSLRIDRLHPGWDLCPAAESSMRESLRLRAIMNVNDGSLAVMADVRLTAIATSSITTNEGTFVMGNWYSPKDPNTREILKDAFDQGIAHVRLEEGTWALIRPVREMGAPILVNRVQNALQTLPDSLPPFLAGLTRREFRTRSSEETLKEGEVLGTG